jgi:transketolase
MDLRALRRYPEPARSDLTIAPQSLSAASITLFRGLMAVTALQIDMANAIRALAMDAVEAAKSGHPGMPMGMADVATVLFGEVMRYDAADPSWPNRDRFVLSAGHGSMLLYAALYLTGTPGMTLDEIKNFRQLGAKTAGHPEYGHAPGIETTTGPLGQGIANAVGLALGERLWNARLGDVIDHHTYVIAGDGCLQEGLSQEAISLAGHLGLGKLIVTWDDNAISIDGPTSLATSEDQIARFKAAGWNTARVDGHDQAAIKAALLHAKSDASKPWLIAAKSTIGYGAPTKAGKASSHGSPLGPEEIKGARDKLGWPHGPFVIPDPVLKAWREAGAKGAHARKSWTQAWDKIDPGIRAAFAEPTDGTAGANISAAIQAMKKAAATETAKKATRQWSEATLDKLVPASPALIGGSADLTGSNNTKAKGQPVVARGDFKGSYIHYGIREHGMAAAMNGLALYGGLIPYGGTFLVFTDYCRPSIRLSALMGQRVIYVMTHDSIGLGEDGPTHQPVEHLAALRTIPNLLVLRPADGVETAECWEIAIKARTTPSILALTRQAVANLRTTHTDDNLSAKGGYLLAGGDGTRHVTLMATGSEVTQAMEAHAALAKNGIAAAVVSMPSIELFEQQPPAYRKSVLGDAPRIAIEAAVRQSWDRYLRDGDVFIGMTSFGASAPAPKLFEHFGITTAKIVDAAKALAKR